MKNFRKLFFAAFFIIYGIGIFSGSMGQVKEDNQQEIYTYLEGAISAYDAKLLESITAIWKGNIGLFILCAAGMLFKIAVPLPAIAILMRGYSAGFAITAAMRLYGFGGIFLSLANIISLAFLIKFSLPILVVLPRLES